MRYKLLVIDIDGTVLDKNRNISAEDKEALAEAARAGVLVSLSTGRALMGAVGVISELGLDGYHITFDGALVSRHEGGEEVYAQPISPAVVREAVGFAAANEIALELFSARGYFVEHESWSTEAHRQFFGLEATVVNFDRLWEKERLIKGGLVVNTPEERERALRFEQHFAGSLDFSWAATPAFPGVHFINVLEPGVSKGKALEALAAHLGMSTDEVVAIGDGRNDISLLKAAGLAIAMGNAVDEVKAVADYITLDIGQSGVAKAIREWVV